MKREYQIITAQTTEQLEAKVNNEFTDGWLITGAPFVYVIMLPLPVIHDTPNPQVQMQQWLGQAMIRYNRPEEA